MTPFTNENTDAPRVNNAPSVLRLLKAGTVWDWSLCWASLVAQMVKNPPAMRETWVGKMPWRREQLPAPVFWPGESHGQRSLAGCCSWGHQELDTTEWLSHTHAHTHTYAHTHRVCCTSLSYCLKLDWCEKASLISVFRAGWVGSGGVRRGTAA